MTDLTKDQKDAVSQFVGVTGADQATAVRILTETEWNLESSVTTYYEQAEEIGDQEDSPESPPLNPQPIPTTSNMPPPPAQPPKKKFSTLGDLHGGAGGSHAGHDHDGDDSDDDDDNQNLYTGGEKSGLAVSNPDDLKKKIIERAKRNVARPGGDDPRAAPSHFKGTARTLGGDDAPSEVIEDPSANRPTRPEPVERILHFWADGFSVDDGPLFRHDDPQNAAILSQIKSGRAPLSILNVEPGQEVDVKLEQHSNDNYVKPKQQYKPFSGSGQRLGSPTPGSSAPPPPSSASTSIQATSSTTPSNTQSSSPAVNESEPVITLQIRLGDGTRLPARFNTTHTIADVYEFINSASAASRTGAWVLMTTFPSTELTDKTKQLGELSETKRGGTVVQKWKT